MQYLLHSSIPSAFLEYLGAANFSYFPLTKYSGHFTRGKVRVSINHLKVRVAHYSENPGNNGGESGLIDRVHEFSDIHNLDFIGWVMLLELTGAVRLHELVASVSRKELSTLIWSLCKRLEWPGPSPEIPTLERQDFALDVGPGPGGPLMTPGGFWGGRE
jgi:hypothetical protein